MSNRLYDIAIAIAPAITQRTMENLRRSLEELWVKSTAEGALAEDVAAFNPELIAMAHTVAKIDNAQMIYEWARALDVRLSEADQLGNRIESIQGQIAAKQSEIVHYHKELQGIKEGEFYPTLSPEERERKAEATTCAVQRTQKEVESYEAELRNLRQTPVAERPTPPYPGAPGQVAPGSIILDGSMPDLSRPGTQ